MPKPAYTTIEKLRAEQIKDALEELAIAHDAMRRDGWHISEDKNLRTLWIGVNAAMNSQHVTHAAAESVLQARHEAQINRLPEWSGYPDDAQTIQEDGTIK